MPPTKRQPQNQRQRPFKVPRRQTSPPAKSSSAAANSKPKTITKPPKNTTGSSSKSKPARPSASSSSCKNKSRAKADSPAADDDDAAAAAAAAAVADSEPESDNGSVASNRSRSPSRERSPSGEPDYILAEITNTEESNNNVVLSEPEIPPKLLTRLLHTHFQNPKTKIAKDANAVVAKYMDVFVREALARAAFERAEVNGEGASFADGFLEVCLLLSPYLVLFYWMRC